MNRCLAICSLLVMGICLRSFATNEVVDGNLTVLGTVEASNLTVRTAAAEEVLSVTDGYAAFGVPVIFDAWLGATLAPYMQDGVPTNHSGLLSFEYKAADGSIATNFLCSYEGDGNAAPGLYRVTASNYYRVWDAGTDGSGSGLDADLFDGQDGSHYLTTSGGTVGSLIVDGNLVVTNGTVDFANSGITHLGSDSNALSMVHTGYTHMDCGGFYIWNGFTFYRSDTSCEVFRNADTWALISYSDFAFYTNAAAGTPIGTYYPSSLYGSTNGAGSISVVYGRTNVTVMDGNGIRADTLGGYNASHFLATNGNGSALTGITPAQIPGVLVTNGVSGTDSVGTVASNGQVVVVGTNRPWTSAGYLTNSYSGAVIATENFDTNWPSGLISTNYTQVPTTNPVSGWVVNDARMTIAGAMTLPYVAMIQDTNTYGKGWVQTPLFTNGIGRFIFNVRTSVAPISYNVESSSDGVVWVTNSSHVLSVTTWEGRTNTYNTTNALYLRIRKTSDARNRFFRIDNCTVTECFNSNAITIGSTNSVVNIPGLAGVLSPTGSGAGLTGITAAQVGAVSTNGVTSIIYSNASAFQPAGNYATGTPIYAEADTPSTVFSRSLTMTNTAGRVDPVVGLSVAQVFPEGMLMQSWVSEYQANGATNWFAFGPYIDHPLGGPRSTFYRLTDDGATYRLHDDDTFLAGYDYLAPNGDGSALTNIAATQVGAVSLSSVTNIIEGVVSNYLRYIPAQGNLSMGDFTNQPPSSP